VSLHTETGTILHIPLKLHRRGGRKLIITPDASVIRSRRRKPDAVIIRALALSYRWLRQIETGEMKNISALARKEGLSEAYVQRRLNLTCLSPRIIEAALDGVLPKGTKLADLLRVLDLIWADQEIQLDLDEAVTD
jgi:hypothetical protein